jgi:hypothetical protein
MRRFKSHSVEGSGRFIPLVLRQLGGTAEKRSSRLFAPTTLSMEAISSSV